jgi:polyphosphate kinase
MADISQLSVEVHVDSSEADRRIAWLLKLPRAVQRFIPLSLAVWWTMRGIKVKV